MNPLFNGDFLISSDRYGETMNSVVLPFLASREKAEKISGFEDKPLYCVSYEAENPRGTVLVLHGFTENAYKFSELIYSLLNNRFSVVSYDQRGHGRSWRAEGIRDGSVTHVDRFSDYVSDLRAVCRSVLARFPKPWMIFAHSMGGAVATSYLEEYPETFSAAALCAPMIAPNLGGLPKAFARTLCRTAKTFGRERNRPFFMKPYSGHEDFNTSCASDFNRFKWYDDVKAARKEFQNSIPSYLWTFEAVNVTEKLLAAGAPEKIACPVLLFTADQDFSVLPAEQKLLISRIKKGKNIFVKGSRHEIYRSENSVLFPWWHMTLSFLSNPESLDDLSLPSS